MALNGPIDFANVRFWLAEELSDDHWLNVNNGTIEDISLICFYHFLSAPNKLRKLNIYYSTFSNDITHFCRASSL